MRRNPVHDERKLARIRRHGARKAADLSTWLQDGPVIECDDCDKTERENCGTFTESDGRTLCPMCALKADS